MIDILLATYNGESYLREQLDSIIHQDYSDWQLLVRDDLSDDGTVDILSDYLKKYPEKITIIDNDGENLGACLSFAELLSQTGSEHIMICDQDDVWLPNKISLTMQKILDMEKLYGKEIPLLVHTDFTVVDANLNVVAESGWKYLNIDPIKGVLFNRLLVNNTPTGCTIMVNRALCKLALPIPSEAIMHDWWLSLVAAMFGHICHINSSTMLYRQHGKNASGDKKQWGAFHVFRQIKRLDYHRGKIKLFRKQAGKYLDNYHDKLNLIQKKRLIIYSRLDKESFFMKRYYILKYGFFYVGFLRNLGLLIIC